MINLALSFLILFIIPGFIDQISKIGLSKLNKNFSNILSLSMILSQKLC